MSKWIELNNGDLVNLDMASCINKYKGKLFENQYYSIIYSYGADPDYGFVEEKFNDEEKRDKRFEDIKAILGGAKYE